jgi:hypothetical protein
MCVINGSWETLRHKGLRSPLSSNVLLVLSDYKPHPIPMMPGQLRSNTQSQIRYVESNRNWTPAATVLDILD